MSRFSHLDFDGPMEEPKPKPKFTPGLRPPPLTGATWRDAGQVGVGYSRIEIPNGRGIYAYFDANPERWSFTDGPMPTIRPKQVEIDVATREEDARFGMDALLVRLGIRHIPEVAWEYQQVTITYEAMRDLRYETTLIRKPFAPGHAAVVAVDPKARRYVRAYVESSR